MKKNNYLKKILVFIMVFAICISIIPNVKADESEFSISKEVVNLKDEYTSQVSLSLERKNDEENIIDIEFVVDGSKMFTPMPGPSAIISDFGNAYIDGIYELITYLQTIEDVKINVGIMGFSGITKEFMALTDVTELTSKDTISEKFTPTANLNFLFNAYGSNLHSGLVDAKEVLDNSQTGSIPSRRYVVLLTDGGNYTYDNSKGETSSTIELDNTGYKNIGNDDANTHKTRETKIVKYYNETQNYASAFSKLMEEYDDVKAQADKGYKWLRSMSIVGNALVTNTYFPAEDVAEINQLEADGKLVVYKSDDEIADTTYYPYLNMEIGTAMAAGTLKEMADNGYNIFAIGHLYEHGFDSQGNIINPLHGLPSRCFLEWTETIGSLYMQDSVDLSTADLESIFNDIKNDVKEDVENNLFIIDEMASGTTNDGFNYNFEFINDIDSIDLKENGTTLDKETISDNTYGFGKEGNSYKYILTYNATNNSIRLDINYNLAVGTKANLLYNIKLDDETINNITDDTDLSSLKSSNASALKKNNGDDVNIFSPTISYEKEKYQAQIAGNENATITLSKEDNIKAGTKVTATITCDSGYEFSTFSIIDNNSNNISYTENDGSYTFNMPESDIKVNGSCKPIATTTTTTTTTVATKEANPNTGDNIYIYLIGLILSIIGLIGIGVLNSKKAIKKISYNI